MQYREILNSVDTEKALLLLGLDSQSQGSYVKFTCPSCQQQAVIKAHGEKKNLYYCPKCRLSGHIISLAMKLKKINWDDASRLLAKAQGTSVKLTKEMALKYELQYHPFLLEKGLSQKVCEMLEIGVPKGKTMLSGCVAFTIHNDKMERIAYYGINMKTGKPIFHKSFNPELYLYGYSFYSYHKENIVDAYFTNDMFECVRILSEDEFCVCNFGLPYISDEHLKIMEKIPFIKFRLPQELVRVFAVRMADTKAGLHCFL